MKRSKLILLIAAAVILIALVVAVIYAATQLAPTVNHALRITELLQPVIHAENQSMHVSISADLDTEQLRLESDIYSVTDANIRYLALTQENMTLYIADNILILENGKAFHITDQLQRELASWDELLPQIGKLFETLKITTTQKADAIQYEITVTGEQMSTLLTVFSMEDVSVENIQEITLSLTESNDSLEKIVLQGEGEAKGMPIRLEASITDFQILRQGDLQIPSAVRETANSVDPNTLFSITQDLYRLVLAFMPLTEKDSLDGNLKLYVDCGLLQLDTDLKLSNLKTSSIDKIDPQKLQGLPEALGWLCLEGDIQCVKKQDSYVYSLELDREAMQSLATMILPELAQYGSNLTKGIAEITLKAGAITTMELSIKGKIDAKLVRIPITVGAEFSFD